VKNIISSIGEEQSRAGLKLSVGCTCTLWVCCWLESSLEVLAVLLFCAGRNKMKDWDSSGAGPAGDAALAGGEVEGQSDSDAGDDEGW